jgi:hypothetical protein
MIYQGIRVYEYTRIPGLQNAFSISALERATLPMSPFVLQGHIHARELPPGWLLRIPSPSLPCASNALHSS